MIGAFFFWSIVSVITLRSIWLEVRARLDRRVLRESWNTHYECENQLRANLVAERIEHDKTRVALSLATKNGAYR